MFVNLLQDWFLDFFTKNAQWQEAVFSPFLWILDLTEG